MSGKGLFSLLAALAILNPAWAFNPPEDTAGPVTIRIAAPEIIGQLETPCAVEVSLVNASDEAVAGSLRIGVIDTWRVEPAEAVAFRIEARGEARYTFNVIVGAGAYNALYPIHAFAEFAANGQAYAAHAVKIVETQLPEVPEPNVEVPWRPIVLAADTEVSLDQSLMRRVVIEAFGEEPVIKPVAWHGSDERTRGAVDVGGSASRPDARRTIAMHPPWYGGHAGAEYVEFPVRLPEDVPIRLAFANAIRDNDVTRNEPASDGVTFRVRVADFDAPAGAWGDVVFEQHTDAKQWQDANVDLGAYTGQTIRLQLEVHPGPTNDTTCDQGYWGAPRLIAGDSTRRAIAPAEPKPLGVVACGGDSYDVLVALGTRGILDGRVVFRHGDQRLECAGFSTTVLKDALEQPGALTELVSVEERPADHGRRIVHRFEGWAGAFDLVIDVWLEASALRVAFAVEGAPEPKPWQVVHIEDAAAGPWTAGIERVYAGPGNVIAAPEAFRLYFDGHQCATSFAGFEFDNGMRLVQGLDAPPSFLEVTPASRHFSFHTPDAQTMSFIPCPTVWEGAKAWHDVNGLGAAGGVARAAGRFVFDLWGGHYASSADALERAFRYGLTDSMVVWHNWQRWGYDYRLPDIYPPNPDFGTLDEFQRLAQVCKDRDVVFAPHDNYIDFYPDAEGYSYRHIAFTNTGAPIRAWLNEGRDAQSYRWRADTLEPFLERNVAWMRDTIAPTGYFIDVWSSIGPYDYWTHDGQFFTKAYTRTRWGEFFAYIRDQFGGNAPQISESGHDQLIGWLDGAQTNHLRVDAHPTGESWTTWRITCKDAERVPWFDTAHHDRFVLHGAGYSSRYQGGLDGALHGIYSDDYIATEVLTGHPAMVPVPFGRDVVRKYWLLHDLMRALALERIDSVEFADGDMHRQYVRWQNGAEVWMNRGADDWSVGDHVLPQYGFFARVGDVEAAIERLDGVIAEWSRGPGGVYVNARPYITAKRPIRVSVESVEYLGERACEVTLQWQADKPLDQDCRVFVHGVDAGGEILFQGDHDAPVPTTQWQGVVSSTARLVLPKDATAGTAFELRVGLYVSGGARVPIEGTDDGQTRIRLGTLMLVGDGARIDDVTWNPRPTEPDPLAERFNVTRKAIRFGGIITDGACRVAVADDAVVVTPLPESPSFAVRLNYDAMGWTGAVAGRAEALAEDGSVVETIAVRGRGREIGLPCAADVFAYRLTSE